MPFYGGMAPGYLAGIAARGRCLRLMSTGMRPSLMSSLTVFFISFSSLRQNGSTAPFMSFAVSVITRLRLPPFS